MLQEPLPEGADIEGPVRLCVEADLSPDGAFGTEWLVVADGQLRVLSREADSAEVTTRLALSLDELKEPKLESFVGGGALEVKRNGTRIELVRFSAARVPRFASAVGVLAKWLEGNTDAPVPEEEQRRCPRCKLPLEAGTQVCPACVPKSRVMLRLVSYLRPHWKIALILTFLAMATTALSLVAPYLNRPLLDVVLAPRGEPRPMPERMSLLGILVLVLLASRVVASVLGVMREWLQALLGNRLVHDIRGMVFQHLQYLSVRFFDKRQIGTVISRVNQDIGQLQAFLVWGAQELVTNLLLIIGIGVVLCVLNWKLALLVFVPAPAIAILTATFWKRLRYFMHRLFHRWGKLNAILNESLSGLRVVRAFAQEPREVSRFREASESLATAGVQAERMFATVFAGMGLIIGLGTLLVWYIGGRSVLGEEMTIGTLTAYLAFVGMFYGPVQSMSMLVNWASRSLTAAERVFEVLDTLPEVQEADEPRPLPRLEGRVEFRDVTFGYEKHSPVLKHVSFEVEPGEMIGLVGHSGAGKTTTINLLCRFYDVDEGEVLVDGIPIKDVSISDLRRQIGIVPQDTFLFSGTIADNIAYAKPGATHEEVVRAAKAANAHDFIIRKPDGYETLIGEGGAGLSTGERQRVAIARALLHNPRILILDEATSQVDVEAEKQIQEAIARLVKGRTTFAIAHRLATLRNADRLLVLKGGEIAEIGTHDELLAKPDGEFRRLVDTYQEISKVRAVQR